MNTKGFIQLSREFLNWQWYDDDSAMRVFLHLLLTANFTAVKWHGITIERGQRVITLNSLADETGISKATVLSTLKKLQKSGDIEQHPTTKYTVITVKNYDDFTMPLPQTNRNTTDNEPIANRKPTAYYNNNNNKENNDNNVNKGTQKIISGIDIDLIKEKTYNRYRKRREENSQSG